MTHATQAIREGIKEATRVLVGDQGILDRPAAFTYVPASHARALDPDATLIEGIRGAGKSFWFSLLASTRHRAFVRSNFPEARLSENSLIARGFGTGLSTDDAPNAETLVALVEKYKARAIWRAVVAHQARVEGDFAEQKSWFDRVEWVQANPESFARSFEAADQRLAEKKATLLILFDALDRMADDWSHVHQLSKGLLQVALDMRSTRSIRCKVFVRPDLLQDSNVTSFPDYSKLLATKASLIWYRADLYALLYQCLGNASISREHFLKMVVQVAGKDGSIDAAGDWLIPGALRQYEPIQEALFEFIAGKAMGSSTKRGKPYTWLVNHLQDGLNQVSPRSFYAALGMAARETPHDYDFPLDYRGIQRGVQEASGIRVQEIIEDYPWVGVVMKPLRGNLTVPCAVSEIEAAWKANDTLARLDLEIQRSGEVVKLPPQNLDQGGKGILLDLQALGMVDRQPGNRIQMPDVYRVAFGFGRRGGVKPLR